MSLFDEMMQEQSEYEKAIEELKEEVNKLREENKQLKEITNSYDAFGNDYIPNDMKFIIADREYFHSGIFKESFIPISVIQNKITEEIKYHEKNISNIETITTFQNMTPKEQAEIEFNKYAIVVLHQFLSKLLEERNK